MPKPTGDRLDGGDVVGVYAKGLGGGSYVWVVPTDTGVVLIDAGQGKRTKAIEAEVDGREVHAVLLTHGHFDHTKGLPQFPDAQVYAGPGEGPLVRGEVLPGGFGARVATGLLGGPRYAPPLFREFRDGETLEIDGESFHAIHVPGHTSGGAAYIWRDVAFTGDVVIGRGDFVSPVPALFYDDFDIIGASVSKILDVPWERLADGHAGLHADARSQVEDFVSR